MTDVGRFDLVRPAEIAEHARQRAHVFDRRVFRTVTDEHRNVGPRARGQQAIVLAAAAPGEDAVTIRRITLAHGEGGRVVRAVRKTEDQEAAELLAARGFDRRARAIPFGQHGLFVQLLSLR